MQCDISNKFDPCPPQGWTWVVGGVEYEYNSEYQAGTRHYRSKN